MQTLNDIKHYLYVALARLMAAVARVFDWLQKRAVRADISLQSAAARLK